MGLLEGKVAIVTGSGAGIGLGVAKYLATEGAKVVVCDINAESVQKAVTEIKAQNGDVLGIKTDVTSRAEVQNLVKETLEKWGQIDILVNNAGITRDASFKKMTEDMWDMVMNVNLKSMYYTCQEVLPHMVAKAKSESADKYNNGKIINISSTGADGNFGQANYSASKAGVVGFTKTLAKEYARHRIQVNALKPGYIKSQMTDAMPEKIKQMATMAIPLGYQGLPEDVAKVILFFASDMSNYVTGEVLRVGGGLGM